MTGSRPQERSRRPDSERSCSASAAVVISKLSRSIESTTIRAQYGHVYPSPKRYESLETVRSIMTYPPP
jgi:hypothetical protein